MNIELRPLADVKPYENNPRINNAAVDAVARSIREFGFRQPIVVDKTGVIVAGHTRWKAAKTLGLTNVPVHVAKDLTAAQAKAYRIADNQTATLAEWDFDMLPIELSDLQAMDVNFDLLGFSSEELEKILGAGVHGNDGLTDADIVPEPPDEATTQVGDLWILGDHRLLCGDSSKPEDVDRVLGNEVIHLVNMDPPYNVKVEPRSNNAIAAGVTSFSSSKTNKNNRSTNGKNKKQRTHSHHQSFDLARGKSKATATHKKMRARDRPLENDFLSDEAFVLLLRAWFGNAARVLVPGRGFYIWGGYANCANYPAALAESGLYFSQAVIWVKEHPVLTRKDFMGNHEWCFYGWKEGAAHYFTPEICNATDVWSVKKINPQSMVHLTEKPVELATRAMMYSSKPGEHVLDLFGGSGSTLIAAEQAGRRAFLLELDTLYCDVIVERWEQFTGRRAERECQAVA